MRKDHDIDYSTYMRNCTLKLYDFEYSYLVEREKLLQVVTLLILSLHANNMIEILDEIRVLVYGSAQP